MKKKITDLLKTRKFAAGLAAVALAAIIGGTALVQQSNDIPELPVYTDPVMETTIEDDEPPLASTPKTTSTTKTSKKTSSKTVKLSKAATKTYTKTLPTTKKTSSKTSNSSTKTVVTKTTVSTAVKEKYTKKSKTKKVTTTVTTTVKTTTTVKATTTTTNTTNTTTKTSTTAAKKYTVDVAKIAPLMDSKVLNAYKTLGFTVTVDPTVSYAGYFNASTRSITLQTEDDTIYHELGHFVAFISGNTDRNNSFTAIYSQEKGNYTGFNKAYVTQDSSEYYAESVRDYILNRNSLQSSRPQTYAALNAALAKITDAQVAKIKTVFASVWS